MNMIVENSFFGNVIPGSCPCFLRLDDYAFHMPEPDMGNATSDVFSGKCRSETNRKVYAETADFFASEIKKRFIPGKTYTLADIGAYQGELLGELLRKLPDYKFKTIAVDIAETALTKNKTAQEIVCADACDLPLPDTSIDIAIVRYLLQWNAAERQERILNELARIVRGCAFVEHTGADVVDTVAWRERMDRLLSGKEIPKLKRGEHFFSSRDEVEAWMRNLGIEFLRLKDRIIADGADVYIERYALDADEAKAARQILGEKNYARQTDWVIFPKNTF